MRRRNKLKKRLTNSQLSCDDVVTDGETSDELQADDNENLPLTKYALIDALLPAKRQNVDRSRRLGSRGSNNAVNSTVSRNRASSAIVQHCGKGRAIRCDYFAPEAEAISVSYDVTAANVHTSADEISKLRVVNLDNKESLNVAKCDLLPVCDDGFHVTVRRFSIESLREAYDDRLIEGRSIPSRFLVDLTSVVLDKNGNQAPHDNQVIEMDRSLYNNCGDNQNGATKETSCEAENRRLYIIVVVEEVRGRLPNTEFSQDVSQQLDECRLRYVLDVAFAICH